MIDVVTGLFTLLCCLSAGLTLWHFSMGPAASRAARVSRVILLSLVLVPLLAFSTWRLSKSRDLQICGAVFKRVDLQRPLVALTFDDGPTRECTGEILGVLREKKVRATFFLTGSEMEQHMAETKQIVAEGHELGNHSYSHRPMLACSTAFVRDEIEKTDQLIRSAGHQGTIHFRPPYCKRVLTLPLYLWRTGRTTILFEVEPESFPEVASDAGRIVSHVEEKIRPGSIVLLHLMYPGRSESRKALPGIIDALRAKGFGFVTVSELLAS